jgi:hypothetical protein
MRALLDNATLTEHDNLIGVLDGAESMRDYQCCGLEAQCR